MKVELTILGNEYWPRCYYNPDLRCGDPETRGTGGPSDQQLVRRNWHVADFCECPSCPLRCAIRDSLVQYKEKI